MRSKGDSGDVDKGEEILPIVNLILRPVQPLALLVSKYLHQQRLHSLLLPRSRLHPVNHRPVATEAHHRLDDQPQHLHVDVQLVDLGEVRQAYLGEGALVGLQLGLQGLPLLLPHVVEPALELELLHRDLQLLPRPVDELSDGGGVPLLSFLLGVVVLVVGLVLFVELDVEDVDGPAWWEIYHMVSPSFSGIFSCFAE